MFSRAVVLRSAAPVTGTFGAIFPKVDFHKDVVVKHVPKASINPYAAGFMEELERKSLAAQPAVSNQQNDFKFCQHTGSSIMNF